MGIEEEIEKEERRRIEEEEGIDLKRRRGREEKEGRV